MFVVRKIFMDYVVPDKKGVLFVLPINIFLQAANKCHDTRGIDNIKKACDLVIQELHDRFGQREVMKPIVTLESLLLKSANGEECIQLGAFRFQCFCV